MPRKLDLTGQRFGKLEVIQELDERRYVSKGKRGLVPQVQWACVCDCGNKTTTTTDNLRSKNTKSCGCLLSNYNDITGQRFGQLVAIKPIGTRVPGEISRSMRWECKCDCGKLHNVRSVCLVTGNIKSCGHKRPFKGKMASCHPDQRNASNGLCDACYAKEIRARWSDKKREAVKRGMRDRYYRNKDSVEGTLKRMYTNAKSRAKKAEMDFDIQIEDIAVLWTGVCPIFRRALNLNCGPDNYDDAPSLDRIDSNRGYVRGNVQIISFRANSLKSDSTPEERRLMYEHDQRMLREVVASNLSGSTISKDDRNKDGDLLALSN